MYASGVSVSVGGSLLLLLLVGAVPAAQAQQPRMSLTDPSSQTRWLVLPSTSTDRATWMKGASEAIRSQWKAEGQPAWGSKEAAERFEAVGSAPAPALSQSDIDRWVERSQSAVRYLARADYRGARRELQAAQRVADRAAAELNREAARARQVLDTCLYMVRAYVETKNRADARQQARECRRLVPSVEPTAFRHTPEVRQLLGQVDEELAAEAPGTLQVESEPSGCLVRINGIAFGQTPVNEIELPIGTYRLQVECNAERRARVQPITLVSGPNHVLVDARFQQVVHTRPELYLSYPDARDEARYRMVDGQKVADALNAKGLLVVTRPQNEILRVDLSAQGWKPASVWLPIIQGGLTAEDVERAVEALLEGRSVDFTGPQPITKPSWYDEAQARLASADEAPGAEEKTQRGPDVAPKMIHLTRPQGQRIAGWTLVGLGAAGIGTSLGLHLRRGTLGDDLIAEPADLQRARDWRDLRIGVWVGAGVGGAALVAALPLVLPDALVRGDGGPKVPWWSWLSGGAGLGLTAYAIYEAATLTSCPEPFIGNEERVRACVDRGQEAGRLSLALAGAAPLLTVPLVYLLRPRRIQPSVSMTADRAMIQVSGSF